MYANAPLPLFLNLRRNGDAYQLSKRSEIARSPG